MIGPLLMTDGKSYRDTRGRQLDAILATHDALAVVVDWPELLAAGERAGKVEQIHLEGFGPFRSVTSWRLADQPNGADAPTEQEVTDDRK